MLKEVENICFVGFEEVVFWVGRFRLYVGSVGRGEKSCEERWSVSWCCFCV